MAGSVGSPEASQVASQRGRRRASFAPSVASAASDRPSPKWVAQRGLVGARRKLSQRTVISTMNPRQR